MENKEDLKELNQLNAELNVRLGGSAEDVDYAYRARRSRLRSQRSGARAAYGFTGWKGRKLEADGTPGVGGARKKAKKSFRAWKIAVGILVLLLALFVGGIAAMRQMGKNSLLSHKTDTDVAITAPEEATVKDNGNTVSYKGKNYIRNEDVASILCMGIDRDAIEDETRRIGENGQADSLFLAALDTSSGNMTLLNISRDSMVDVDLYNTQGEYVETENMQLCLSYAYGDGKKSSCENTMKSVSRLLYGIPVDAYAAIDIPAIGVLNDAIGGVEVDVLEDLSYADPALTEGAHVLLQGSQARTYVRSRKSEGPDAPIDANNYRMSRQKQYVTNFISKALSATKADLSVPLSLYQALDSYMVTDITASEVTYLASLVIQGEFTNQDMVTVPGEVVMGDEYAEYHVDEDALYEMILDIFYKEA